MDEWHGTMIARTGYRDSFVRHPDVRAGSVSMSVAVRDTFVAPRALCCGDLAKRTRKCVVRVGARDSFLDACDLCVDNPDVRVGPCVAGTGPCVTRVGSRVGSIRHRDICAGMRDVRAADLSNAIDGRDVPRGHRDVFIGACVARVDHRDVFVGDWDVFVGHWDVFVSDWDVFVGDCDVFVGDWDLFAEGATVFLSGLRRDHAHVGRTHPPNEACLPDRICVRLVTGHFPAKQARTCRSSAPRRILGGSSGRHVPPLARACANPLMRQPATEDTLS
jgi:hypothetical protein